LIPKTLEEWDIPIIEDLLLKGYYEPEFFDFKEMLPHSKNEEDKERLKQSCCAFANSGGGFLVFGIKDDKKMPIHERLIGIDESLPSQNDFPENFGNYPANCTPSIDWDFRNPPLRLSTGKVIHVVHVPQSWNAPHAFGKRDDGWRFYKRTNKGNEGMSYEEVRLLFLGYYEKRVKLQLLMAELEEINGVANHIRGLSHEAYREKQYSLNTFDLSIVNSVIIDTYTILAEKPELYVLIKSIKTSCVAANNEIQILYRIIDPINLTDDVQKALLIRHNTIMQDICTGIIDKSTKALELLKEISTLKL
jgi:hypothetical protein